MQVQDNKQLEELYRLTMPQVARLVARLNGRPDTARDILHDAIIIYLEKQQNNTLPELKAASAYIIGIARVLCVRQFKQQISSIPLEWASEQVIPEDYFEPPPEQPVMEYLKTAGKKCMDLLKAFYYESRSISDITSIFHFRTLHSASVQKYKCLEKVRNHIKQTDYEERIG
ncbi:sigma-70 family RNA polymerase sigma factor [Chitinophaga silvatica]|uniref:Sigma-70 family RNA polymerase sigma factor n=1 Tax=Chitinophaga silvatica TaxID=2282649 RepID=A0A3E1YHQ0_9BACT|nr:sigma-70 family RNA polymerase sigma factor [Chitinophaga silvatica]RFS26919.1 sigma-70 family RNA polymerase sigma factor [Chitinophaga silvatica]